MSCPCAAATSTTNAGVRQRSYVDGARHNDAPTHAAFLGCPAPVELRVERIFVAVNVIHAWVVLVISAGFNAEDRNVGIFRKTSSDCQASQATANYNVVKCLVGSECAVSGDSGRSHGTKTICKERNLRSQIRNAHKGKRSAPCGNSERKEGLTGTRRGEGEGNCKRDSATATWDTRRFKWTALHSGGC